MATKKSTKSEIDTRIEQAYYRSCSGIQIGIMDIPKVYDHARIYLRLNTLGGVAPTDEDLEAVIRAFVETIRKN